LRKLKAKGVDKFIGYELHLALVERRYGEHFQVVLGDVHESDDLRVLDFNGERAFRLFGLSELGPPTMYEEPAAGGIADKGPARDGDLVRRCFRKIATARA
jgi:hypothetical protein